MDIGHNASEMVQLNAPVPNGHFVPQNNSENSIIHRCLSHKAIVCLVVSVVLNIVLIVVAIVQGVKTSGQPTPCLLCPPGWLQHDGICYYFSTEERNWTSSWDFCSSYDASLATIENEEKNFVMRYKEKVPYWIGLMRRPGEPWMWLNGQPATLEVLGEGENYAYLSDEVDAIASVSRGSTEHHWICSRPAH